MKRSKLWRNSSIPRSCSIAQLSFANHINHCVTKAKTRIAYLYLTLPIYEMPLDLVIQIFHVYLLPIFMYCAAIWSYDLKSQNAIQQINAIFTNYLKRYFGLPKYAHNAAIHFYSGTWTLYYAIKHLAPESILKINFPESSLDDYQLSFANPEPLLPYVPETEMDEDFPRHSVHISRNRIFRRKKFQNLFNLGHYEVCTVEKFHTKLTSQCRCIYCGKKIVRGHVCPEPNP